MLSVAALPVQERIPEAAQFRQAASKGWQAFGRNAPQIATGLAAYGAFTKEDERVNHRRKLLSTLKSWPARRYQDDDEYDEDYTDEEAFEESGTQVYDDNGYYIEDRLPRYEKARSAFSKGWQALGRNSGQITTMLGGYGAFTSEKERLQHRRRFAQVATRAFNQFGHAVGQGAKYPRFQEDSNDE
jgi:hypothetical protein